MIAICIFGESAQGKTPVARLISQKYGYYLIHTDNIYHLSSTEYKPSGAKIGVLCEYKDFFLKHHKTKCTPITIIEGADCANTAELDIYRQVLEIERFILIKLENPNWQRQLKRKYPDPELRRKIVEHFPNHFDVTGYQVATSFEDVDKIIQEQL